MSDQSSVLLETSHDFASLRANSSHRIASPLLTSIGVKHGFGHRLASVAFREDWDASRPQWKQVHGTSIARADDPAVPCGEVDGLLATTPGRWVGAVTADCVPILAARRDGSAAASLHAGWRGTRAGIALRFGELLRTIGDSPTEWFAAIGPSIAPCCFEVSEELAGDFITEFTKTLGASTQEISPRHRILDLPWVNALQLQSLGFARIEILRGTCTKCSRWQDGSPVFHSYRREGGGTRQLSIIRTLAGDHSVGP